MELSDREIRSRYLNVSKEYNSTPLATKEGWVHRPTNFGIRELTAIVRHLPSKGLLVDIGTGKGIAPRFAHSLGAKVITVDSFDAAGTSAIENARLAGIEGHFCDVVRERLPVADNAADCVFFGDVIEHLLHSPKPVLIEIHRVLKPGGVCIATTPNALRLTVRLRVLAGYSNWANLDEFFDKPFHSGHHHEYTIQEFKDVFLKTGFEIADFMLYEDSLRNVKVASLADVKTQGRSKANIESEPLVVRLGRRALLGLTKLAPSLRSNMLIAAVRK